MLFKSLSVFLLMIFLSAELCSSLRILGVFPIGAKSHFVMTSRLMKELSTRGHQVDIINVFPQKKPIPNYRDIVVKDPNIPEVSNNVTYEDVQKFMSISMELFAKMAGNRVCELLKHPAMRDIIENKKGAYDVIVVEMFVAHCYLAFGQHLGAPMVGIVTSKIIDWIPEKMASPLNPSYMPSYFSSFGQQMTFWERLQNTCLINYVIAKMDYYMEDQLEQVQQAFGRKLNSMKELYNDVSLILVNSHRSINDIAPVTPDIIEVGGLHIVDDKTVLESDLQKWLDESHDGCILFSFGSMLKTESFPPDVIKMFYEMFERIVPVRVLWKIGDPTLLPPGVPINVKSSEWIPQIPVLKHKNLKLFITHGGLMGTQEAIVYKVPMVGLPLFADQYTNIQSYANKKIAIALSHDNLTADILTDAVKTVLYDPTYRKNIEKLSNLFLDRPMSAIDTAVYWVEYTARHPKVLNSPAMKLMWWQYYLLDVYGFMLALILITLFIIKRTVEFLWRCLCVRIYQGAMMKLKKDE